MTELPQCASVGQVGSPPPLTLAELVISVPLAAAVGVTGMTKLTGAPVARPAGIVQVTTCALALQPGGSVPISSTAGMLSLTLAIAVVPWARCR